MTAYRSFTVISLLFILTGIALANENLLPEDLYPPGQIVDVGGHRMHIYCQGRGEPTIVLDSGAGGFSLEWVNIQKAISPQTRVCAYDRAGYGWSDMGPLPRSSKCIVSAVSCFNVNEFAAGIMLTGLKELSVLLH